MLTFHIFLKLDCVSKRLFFPSLVCAHAYAGVGRAVGTWIDFELTSWADRVRVYSSPFSFEVSTQACAWAAGTRI